MTKQEMADRYAVLLEQQVVMRRAKLDAEITFGLLTDKEIANHKETISRLECQYATPEARVASFDRHCTSMRHFAQEVIDKKSGTLEEYDKKSKFAKFMAHLKDKQLKDEMAYTREDLKDSSEIIKMTDEELLLRAETIEAKKYPTEQQITAFVTDKENPTMEDAIYSYARNVALAQREANQLHTKEEPLTKEEEKRLGELTNIIYMNPAELFTYWEENAKSAEMGDND